MLLVMSGCGTPTRDARFREQSGSEEPQMIMEREREHLAQVDHHDHLIVPRDVVGLIVR